MYKIIFLLIFCFISNLSMAALSKGAALLFTRNENYQNFTGTDLSDTDKENIFKLMKLRYDDTKKELAAIQDTNLDFPFHASVRIVDLNRDGLLDVFVSLYNMTYFGQAGQETIFLKSKSGKFMQVAKVDGFCEILKTAVGAYPDLMIGGPGMTAPVMRWKSSIYKFYKNVSFAQGKVPATYSFKQYSAISRKR